MTPNDVAWLDDPAERDWLMDVDSRQVIDNAHRAYDWLRECGMAADSVLREAAFTKAADELKIDYDVLYDAWLNSQPVTTASGVCRHCGRGIVEQGGRWVDPEAAGDDVVWRETCDSHDTFTAEHEPN